ncbi:MAG: asparaginase [Acidiferrobacterales bacterium]|nr:asparaginase [Acidiferrobacterales bacterium]
MQSANPILVEVTRGEMMESFHRGAVAVVNTDGETIAEYGDVNRPIYPRSAIKPLQAMVLVESGALERYALRDEHIALACASHSGQVTHVDSVRHWLEHLGLDETHLECGVHEPVHRKTRNEMIRQQYEPTALTNNCSGKHAGFISVALHCNLPVKGYIAREHPVQQYVLQTLEELSEESLHGRPAGLDGCGIPVTGMSLRGMALAFARLAVSDYSSEIRRTAATRIRCAMGRLPELVGGENRFCTVVPRMTESRVLVKVGAEGVYAGMTSQCDGLGFALKIDDGSRRAAEVAMGWLIEKYCNLAQAQKRQLNPWFRPQVKTVAKRHAGVIRPVFE